MTIEQMMLQSEALIFASERPITTLEIENILKDGSENDELLDLEKLPAALEAVVEKYASDFYPFEIKQIGAGYQFLSKKEMYPTVSRLNGDKYNKKLSTAAMETLAIIAYKQPVTKGDIEHIRGVSSDYSIQKLLEKELIYISGRLEDAVGKPLTYNTTKSFMDYLGVNSLDDLPKLNEIAPYEEVIPTNASEAIPTNYDTQLVVSSDGELQEVNKNEISADKEKE